MDGNVVQGCNWPYNGAVICFQKFNKTQVPPSPACFGSFNRVNVKLIHSFQEYVEMTSRYEAELPCSRKQILLRRIEGMEDQEQVILVDSDNAEANGLPFAGKDGGKNTLGCFSVFNITELKDDAPGTKRTPVQNIREFYKSWAKEIYETIEAEKLDVQVAVFKILGAEDLCVIVLGNDCQKISATIEALQRVNVCGVNSENSPVKYCVDNVHSILMMDRNADASKQDWAGIRAEIYFSLQSGTGMDYLQRKYDALKLKYSDIQLESCSGEYDAVLRGPGAMLPVVLGLPDLVKTDPVKGCFHPNDIEYRQNVFQSDVVLHPFGLSNGANRSSDCGGNGEIPGDKEKIAAFVDKCLLDLEAALKRPGMEHKDFTYLKLPIWRLEKEYWSFASFPIREDLRTDLEYQFKAALNAIVREAEQSDEHQKDFMEKYHQITDALESSMQAGSQQDRWYFGEQRSYVENVDSYYKILRCYYGMLKDMIRLIYAIPRKDTDSQPYLIPLLSFGVDPLIKSEKYDTYIDWEEDNSESRKEAAEQEKKSIKQKKMEKKPANLVCIRLPYQALSNPLKYIGILAHEIFHYAKPANRANRNELMIKGLIRVAVSEFLNILAGVADKYQNEEHSASFSRDAGFSEIVNAVVENIYGVIVYEHVVRKQNFYAISLVDIKRIVEEGSLHFTTQAAGAYFRIWGSIRNYLWYKLKVPADQQLEAIRKLPEIRSENVELLEKMFALNEEPAASDAMRDKKAYFLALNSLYREMIYEVEQGQIRSMHYLLNQTYKAMVECPSDIFDLETVMAGQKPEDKIRQFFWQQFAIKRDLMVPFNENEIIPVLLKNNIRIAMIINYYLRQRTAVSNSNADLDSPSELKKILESWSHDTYRQEVCDAKNALHTMYSQVYNRFYNLFSENNDICMRIVERIGMTAERPEMKKIIDKLSTYYQDYYARLDQCQADYMSVKKQTQKDALKKDREHRLFGQICSLIDDYQAQKAFDISGHTSNLLGAMTSDKEDEQQASNQYDFTCDEVAYNCADLGYCLSRVYDQMMIGKRMPQLWYRGQKQASWQTLPNVMRMEMCKSETMNNESFRDVLKSQVRFAKAHILPEGERLNKAEWLAFLQHYEFKTNALDFSESLTPALFFATEEWSEEAGKLPEDDAVVMVFNPVLFNLVMEALEAEWKYEQQSNSRDEQALQVQWQTMKEAAKDTGKSKDDLEDMADDYTRHYYALGGIPDAEDKDRCQKAREKLRKYLITGIDYEHPPLFAGPGEPEDDTYDYLYNLDKKMHDGKHDGHKYPRAVLVPRHCDRMDKQSGEFVYFNLASKKGAGIEIEKKEGKEIRRVICDYSMWSLERLHKAYMRYFRDTWEPKWKEMGERVSFTPFMCRIEINKFRYRGFKRYVYAMGMHQYSVYPEFDKLAKDLQKDLDLN